MPNANDLFLEEAPRFGGRGLPYAVAKEMRFRPRKRLIRFAYFALIRSDARQRKRILQAQMGDRARIQYLQERPLPADDWSVVGSEFINFLSTIITIRMHNKINALKDGEFRGHRQAVRHSESHRRGRRWRMADLQADEGGGGAYGKARHIVQRLGKSLFKDESMEYLLMKTCHSTVNLAGNKDKQ